MDCTFQEGKPFFFAPALPQDWNYQVEICIKLQASQLALENRVTNWTVSCSAGGQKSSTAFVEPMLIFVSKPGAKHINHSQRSVSVFRKLSTVMHIYYFSLVESFMFSLSFCSVSLCLANNVCAHTHTHTHSLTLPVTNMGHFYDILWHDYFFHL